jgi:hypothetical protein
LILHYGNVLLDDGAEGAVLTIVLLVRLHIHAKKDLVNPREFIHLLVYNLLGERDVLHVGSSPGYRPKLAFSSSTTCALFL